MVDRCPGTNQKEDIKLVSTLATVLCNAINRAVEVNSWRRHSLLPLTQVEFFGETTIIPEKSERKKTLLPGQMTGMLTAAGSMRDLRGFGESRESPLGRNVSGGRDDGMVGRNFSLYNQTYGADGRCYCPNNQCTVKCTCLGAQSPSHLSHLLVSSPASLSLVSLHFMCSHEYCII